jgi:hypothetical protein
VQRHPVPLSEEAIRALSNTCMPLDLYLWLAYRLHSLSRPKLITWLALHAQFGAATRELFHFKPRFVRDLQLATAIYPEARVELVAEGLRLLPSPAPLSARTRSSSWLPQAPPRTFLTGHKPASAMRDGYLSEAC